MPQLYQGDMTSTMPDKEDKDQEPDNEETGQDVEQEDQGVPVAKVHIFDNETNEELGVVTVPGVTPDEPEEEVVREALQFFNRAKAAEDSLDPDFIEGASKTFPADTLLGLAAMVLTKSVVSAYLEKLDTVLNDQGAQAIDTSLSHLKPTTDDEGNPTVEIVLEDPDFEKIQAHNRELLNDMEEPSVEFMRYAWTHITTWASNLMEEEIGLKKLEAMSDQEFSDTLHDFTFDKNPVAFKDRLGFLANAWAEGVGRMLIDSIDPASRSLEELEALMGLRPEKAPVPLEPDLFKDADYVPTSNAPTSESTRQAITKSGGWFENANGDPEFTFPIKGGKSIDYGLSLPEHIAPIGNLDLAYARREILGDVRTANLERALAAYALRHGPWGTFYLDGDSLFVALGIKGRKDLSHGQKLKHVEDHARRLSYLRIKSVTSGDYLQNGKGKYRGKPVRTITTREDQVWHIAIENIYQDPLDGDGEPELASVVLKVTPGEWGRIFLDKNNPRLCFYRHTAAPQLNPYTQYLASLLEPHLEHLCTTNRKRLPWAVKVGTLLSAVLDGVPKRGGGYYDLAAIRTGTPEDRREVADQWDEAFLTLRDKNWTIDFDPTTYPEELRPAWALEDKAEEAHKKDRRRPKGYWDPLMAAKVFVSWPPDMAAQYPKPPQKKRRPPASTITGEQVRAARIKAGLTQAQLAERLGISRPLIGLVEQGRRGTPELLKRISKELGL